MVERAEISGIRGLTEQIGRIDLAGNTLGDVILPELSALLDTEIVCLYSLRDYTGSWKLERFDAAGEWTKAGPLMRRVFERGSDDPLFYDPGAPDPEQRNRVVNVMTRLAATAPGAWEKNPVNVGVCTPLKVQHYHHVRALLCDGPRLLAWFGVMIPPRSDPRLVRILRALLKPMRRRLLVEEQLRGYAYVRPAFSVMLDRVGAPAFVVTAKGNVLEANSAGEALLATRSREIRDALIDAVAGRGSAFELVELATGPEGPMRLAVMQTSSIEQRIEMCVRVCTRRWGVTPRQAATLGLLVRGLSNATIAATLECSERTVELHVTALLDRARVEGRSALVAAVLTSVS
jgi:DNA-binding CsgD family transcriptional regulator